MNIYYVIELRKVAMRKEKIALAAIFVSVVLLFPAVSSAENIFAIDGAPTYEGYPGQNWLSGSAFNELDSELWTGSFWNDLDTRTYLMFDLTTLTMPVQSAYLYMYNGINQSNTQYPSASTFGPAVVNVYQAPAGWTSSGITWNNQPALGAQAASATVGDSLGWYSWDLTSLINSNIGSSLSLALVSEGPGHVYYGNLTDTGNNPYLGVTTVPEPIASVLFLLGGGALAGAGFRKKS